MEIGRWLCFAVNCAILCYIAAKPFSINKLIESESDLKVVTDAKLSPKREELEPAAERFSLNKGLSALNRKSQKFKETGTKLNLIPLGKRISPLTYKKTFQIKSPLKPKRVKNSLRTRHKRKNQSIKREIYGNELLNKKYVPLLRSLGMLFDNILGTDSGESREQTKRKKRLKFYFDGDDISCKCPKQGNSDSKPKEETVTFSKALAPEVTAPPKVATETTDNPSAGNLRNFRHHKDLPLLLPRNTSGAGRNHYEFGERSRTADNGSFERYISGNHGDSEHSSKHRQKQSYAESDEEYTDSDPRNHASRVQFRGTVRGREHRNNTEEVHENDAIRQTQDETENFMENRENVTQHNGAYKFKTERNKTKSRKLLSEPVRRERGFLSNDKVVDFAESVQSEENDKEDVFSVSHDSTGGKRLADGDGAHSAENKKADTRTQTVERIDGKAANRYYAKPVKVKELHYDYSASEQKYDYDESVMNISYDNTDLQNSDINDSHSLEAQKTNKSRRSETERYEEPIVTQSHITEKTEVKSLAAKLLETQYEEEKDNGTEHESNVQLDGHNNYSVMKVIHEKDAVDELPETEKPQLLPKSTQSRGPVVMIIDGYSVTRHKNGENKLSGKAIRIRP